MQEARIELLQRMAIFGGIRTEVLQFLVGMCPIVSVSANDFFFREHDQGDSMFVLERGKAAVLKSRCGQQFLLQTLKGGDCFGEMALMDHCSRSASIRAVEDCIAIRISAVSLYEVYAQDLKQFALILRIPTKSATRSGRIRPGILLMPATLGGMLSCRRAHQFIWQAQRQASEAWRQACAGSHP